jgi:SAM-dependent methyltransferase
LVPHQDGPKNWDLLVALGQILERTSHRTPVLEMGAARYSPLLTWLYLYGYRRLRGIDLVYERSIRRGPIRLEGMDLTATTYPDHSFGAIACMSVIEHGVDTEAYLREALRLLRPGGVLVTSTDYWPEPINTSGLEAYGQAVRIFDRAAVTALVASAERLGFRPVNPLDLQATDRVVHWERTGLDYTFLNLVLLAPPGGLADRVRSAIERVLP